MTLAHAILDALDAETFRVTDLACRIMSRPAWRAAALWDGTARGWADANDIPRTSLRYAMPPYCDEAFTDARATVMGGAA